MISDETVSFKVEKDKNIKAREILKEVYHRIIWNTIVQCKFVNNIR